ncbi:MAG: DUF2231 domain-containing protein [Pseudomonadota bacterium]
MSIYTRLGIAPLIAALLLSAPLNAHKGHQDDMSDEEMVMMEAGLTDVEDMHAMDHAASPRADPNVAAPAQAMTPAQVMQEKIEENRLSSLSDLISRLHPAVVHFPIALLLLAGMAEVAMKWSPSVGLQTIVRLLVAFGTIGAIIAVLFGWFAGGWRLDDQSSNLAIHRWNGTAIAVLGIAAWTLAVRDGGRTRLRILLAIIAAAIIVQGYYGGEMARGPNHLGIM